MRHKHIAPGGKGGTKERSRLNAVGHHAMLAPVKPFNPFDHNLGRAGAFNLRSHGRETLRKVHHFGLSGCVLDDRGALGKRRSHHDVFCTGHGHHVGHDAGALKAGSPGIHITMVDFDLRPHEPQRLDVLIDRPRTDRATSGKRHTGRSEPSDERPQNKDRGTHRAHKVVRSLRARHVVRMDSDAVRAFAGEGRAHARKKLSHRRHIGKFWHAS